MEPIFTKDLENKKLTVEKVFSAPKAKVWEAWTNNKILEKWWWPKTWPATSVSFDFREWGHWLYYMQWPDGTRSYGRNDYIKIIPGVSYEALDAFCDEHGEVNESMPRTHWKVSFFNEGENTKVIIESTYDSIESLEKLIQMWFQEGFTDALDNLDIIFGKV